MTPPKDAPTTLPPIHRLHPLERTTSLAGYTAIITGAASPLGIGRATAHAFAAAGCSHLYICDLAPPKTSPTSNLDLLSHELRTTYPGCTAYPRHFDASSETDVKAVVDSAVKETGRLDIFFANAGVGGNLRDLRDVGGESFIATMRVNALSVFLAIKYAAPAMVASAAKPRRGAGVDVVGAGENKRGREGPHQTGGGSIIATASVAALRSNAGGSDYSASKAAVMNLVQTSAYQLAGSGVRVNAVLPGLIETGMTRGGFEVAEGRGTRHKMGQINPLKREAGADEVARVVAFLAGEGSSYVQGQGWAVDGGLSAGLPYALGKLA